MEQSERWRRWLSEAPPAAQVALDAALVGLQDRPDFPGYSWAKCAVGLNGIPPACFWKDQLEPGVSWDALAVARGDAYGVPSRRFVGPLNMVFVWVSPGRFTMGSVEPVAGALHIEATERPARPVVISAGFWLGMYPVTNAQFAPVVRSTSLKMSIYSGMPRFNRPDLPVVGVSWKAARLFCKWASASLGLKIRLPWESEWEWAARGPDLDLKKPRLYPWGNEPIEADRAVFDQGGKGGPVAGDRVRGASVFGARDMVGQVWEWCKDEFYPSFFSEPSEIEVTNPRNLNAPLTPWSNEAGHTLRGACWFSSAQDCRCARRSAGSYTENIHGMRLLLEA